MEDLAVRLGDLASQLREVASEVFASGAMRGASEAEIVAVMDAAAAGLRPLEAVIVEAAGEVEERSSAAGLADRMTSRYGCRNPRELVERVTRVSGRRAGEFVAAGKAVLQPIAPTSGQALPAHFPAMREALADGVVGVDAVAAVDAVLGRALPVTTERHAADVELALSARGEGADGAPRVSAEELRLQAQVWAMVLDPDGAEPREARAARKRGITFGIVKDGLVPVRGNLLPDVAAQWQLLDASILNPKLDGPRFVEGGGPEGEDAGDGSGAAGEADLASPADKRTPAQKRHDALATILTVAAGSGELPTIGGAAPTLVVVATEEDVENGTGFAHLDGIPEPVSIGIARQAACCGAIQRVTTNKRGRITRIETTDRVFNRAQRRAIMARDGTCIIPGCTVPAAWCEIHHVIEASRGGPTSTDNGVPLCWHHHRTLETGGWEIRIIDGIPEVRAPGWREPFLTWRPATKSPLALRRRQAARRG